MTNEEMIDLSKSVVISKLTCENEQLAGGNREAELTELIITEVEKFRWIIERWQLLPAFNGEKSKYVQISSYVSDFSILLTKPESKNDKLLADIQAMHDQVAPWVHELANIKGVHSPI